MEINDKQFRVMKRSEGRKCEEAVHEIKACYESIREIMARDPMCIDGERLARVAKDLEAAQKAWRGAMQRLEMLEDLEQGDSEE